MRVFVLAPLAFAHSAADRFWLADARQNRVGRRPLAESFWSLLNSPAPGPPAVGRRMRRERKAICRSEELKDQKSGILRNTENRKTKNEEKIEIQKEDKKD